MENLRYIAISLLIGSALIGCGSSIETAAEYVESGKSLVQEGKLEKARLEFKNAIQIDPRTAEAFYQLALLDEKGQQWKAMYANLSTAEQLDPTNLESPVKLGQLYLLSGNVEKAHGKAKKVLDVQANHVGALVLRASIEMKQQNFGSALKDIEQVLSIDKQNIEAMSVKTISYNQQGDYKKALLVIDEALVIKPDALSLVMIKLSILEEQKDYAAVEKIYRSLRDTKPGERWVVASLAKLLNFQGRYDDAKSVIEVFIRDNPDDRDAKLLLVSLVKTREPTQAIALFEKYIKLYKSDYDLHFAKIKLQLDGGETEEALVGLKEIVAQDSEGNNGRKAAMVLANYNFRQGNMEAVQKSLDRVLAAEPEDEAALILKSKINLLNNNVDQAINDLRLVLRNNLNSDEAMVLIGKAYIQSGSEDLAEDNFRQALSVNPSNQTAALFVADKLLRTDNVDRAESVLSIALQENPNDNALLQALVNIKLRKQDWEGAGPIADAFRTQGNDAVAAYLEGKILQGQGRYEAAIESYKAAISTEPGMFYALQGLAYSYVELDRKEDLILFLNKLIEQTPKELGQYTLLYNLYVSDKNWVEAISVVKAGLSTEPKWQRGYMLLAGAHQRQGDKVGVRKAYESGLKALPENNAIALQLASAYENEGDFMQAKGLYEDILERDATVDIAANNLASLLMDKFQSSENLQKSLEISQRFEDSSEPYFMDTYAWVNVQLGHLEKAHVILESVIEKAPNVAVFNYHLGALHYKKLDKISAVKYLKQAQTIAKDQGDTTLLSKINELLSAM